MASHSPADVTTEFYIDGAWVDTYAGVDLAARVRGADQVRITRGLIDQQSAVAPVQGNITLNNRDSIFTDDHPSSALFGKLGLAARCRSGIKASDGTWDAHILFPDRTGVGGQYVSTTDKASLDIVGDIDIRVEYTSFYPLNVSQPLINKWSSTGSNRSYGLYLNSSGQPSLITSPDGTLTNALTNFAGFIPQATTARIALRVTLDVNDGAGNRVYRWYTSDSITGTWTLRTTGTVAGVTTIVAGNAALEIGSGNGGIGVFTGYETFTGKVHAMEIYNGIAGTLVADLKPRAKALELLTWADTCASPNTWTLNGAYMRLATDRIRIAGELTSLPDSADITGTDVKTQATISGIFQRYSTNKGAFGSAIYRYTRNQSGITGYWPMEDAAGATTAASAKVNGLPGVVTGCTFGTPTGLDGSTGAVTMTTSPTSAINLITSVTGPGSGTAAYVFYFNLNALPASDQVFMTAYCGGGATVTQWVFNISGAGFLFQGYSYDGTLVTSGSTTFGTLSSPLNQWVAMSLQLTTEAPNVRWKTSWHAVGTDTYYTTVVGGTTYVGSVGQFYALNFGTPDAAFAGAQVSHAKMGTVSGMLVNSTTISNVSKGWAGETAGNRLLRTAAEESFAFEWRGSLDNTPAMGPQSADTLYNNQVAAATVDGGILSESRDRLGALYVTRQFLGNRTGLSLSYASSQLAAVPQPVRDNRYTVNDYTASRPSGSSARSEVTDTQLLNTSDPPVGVGRYERSGSINVATDLQLPAAAAKQTAFGAWPERRVPNLAIGLHRSEIYAATGQLDACIQLDFGHPVTLTGLSSQWLPPADLAMVVFGYSEVFDGFEWTITANTVPAGPYSTPVLGNYDTSSLPTLDTTDSLHSFVRTTFAAGATSFVLKTDASGTYPTTKWVDSTSYPESIGAGVTIDVIINGEIITLSDIAVPVLGGGFNEQTATVSARGVRGTPAKSHTAGEPVFLAKPYFIGEY